ncbi:MAG: 1-acyl-sn-glycerol-3-phosphate acyltransferase [Deltaproteobacteria bacterium]|nr:1-acyl-sn-glycerol-3-phosphate acyltransferase [Deltaproteobacteria bacterium]
MLATLIRFVTGVQDRWVGSDPVGPDGDPVQRVYFANHASHLDAPVVWAALPGAVRALTRPVAARDYWTADPLRRFVSGQLRVVLVDRIRVEGGPPPTAPIEQALRDGDSLIFFPEGTRNLDPERGLLAFKSGLYHLARQFPDVEFVPVHLANLNRFLPKGELVPVPVLARVSFGAAVPVREGETKDAYLSRARLALASLSEVEDG